MRFLTSIGASGLFALALLAGCGGGKTTLVVPDPSAPVGLPTPAAAGPVNTYTGTQAPGEWTFTLDNTNDVFSYQPVTYPAAATTGTTTSVNGFTVLSNGGYALEIEGRAAILRPGDSTNAPIFGVPQTECYPLTGRLRFQYVSSVSDITSGTYGSVVASTDATGASWAFQDLEGNEDTGPASFAATCSSTSSESAISFPSQSVLDKSWTGNPQTVPTANTQSNMWIGPSGFFVADQSDPTAAQPTGSSVVGVAEPTTALSASDIASKNYLGFLYELGNTVWNTPTITTPVSFTGLTGEEFLNGDVTQALDPTTITTISLGTQDATYNGRYTSVSITVLDPAQNCATAIGNGFAGNVDVTVGTNSDGYVTCTFPGTAIAGNPGGKYALFITATNWATFEQTQGGAYHMQLYLFQQ